MSQPDCELCGKSADKTNSHILPFSLIKEAVSLYGSKGRDKEAVFSISSNKSMKLYTGRGVIPEKKEKVKEDSDNIEESEGNTTTEDYIFCEDCEKKFGVIESYFSRLVIEPFKQTGIFFSKGELVQVDDKLEGLIIRLYVLGLVWRCSVSTIHPFKLDKILESELKKIIFLSMSTELNELKDNAIKYKDEIYRYPVIAFYGESLADQTGSIVFSTSDLSNASFVFANRFCFMIYNSSNVNEDLSNDIIGFSKYISSHDCLNHEAGKFKFVFDALGVFNKCLSGFI